jgi:hypothetical protein
MADRTVQSDLVIMRQELRDDPPRVSQAQRCLDLDARVQELVQAVERLREFVDVI